MGHPGFFCCKPPLSPCTAGIDCCGNHHCDLIDEAPGKFCCVPDGLACTVDEDCCAGLGCTTSVPHVCALP